MENNNLCNESPYDAVLRYRLPFVYAEVFTQLGRRDGKRSIVRTMRARLDGRRMRAERSRTRTPRLSPRKASSRTQPSPAPGGRRRLRLIIPTLLAPHRRPASTGRPSLRSLRPPRAIYSRRAWRAPLPPMGKKSRAAPVGRRPILQLSPPGPRGGREEAAPGDGDSASEAGEGVGGVLGCHRPVRPTEWGWGWGESASQAAPNERPCWLRPPPPALVLPLRVLPGWFRAQSRVLPFCRVLTLALQTTTMGASVAAWRAQARFFRLP